MTSELNGRANSRPKILSQLDQFLPVQFCPRHIKRTVTAHGELIANQQFGRREFALQITELHVRELVVSNPSLSGWSRTSQQAFRTR